MVLMGLLRKLTIDRKVYSEMTRVSSMWFRQSTESILQQSVIPQPKGIPEDAGPTQLPPPG